MPQYLTLDKIYETYLKNESILVFVVAIVLYNTHRKNKMAKLSTQEIRNNLINNYLGQDQDFTNHIAKELDAELVRIYRTQFGYTDSQIDQALAHARRNPINIIIQYFHIHGDAWLRAQHKHIFG